MPTSSVMIHPHLYGLPAMSPAGVMIPSFEHEPLSNGSGENPASDTEKTFDSQKETSQESQPASNAGGLFHHLSASGAPDWNVFGKTNPKLVFDSAGQCDGVQTSIPEWSLASHQV